MKKQDLANGEPNRPRPDMLANGQDFRIAGNHDTICDLPTQHFRSDDFLTQSVPKGPAFNAGDPFGVVSPSKDGFLDLNEPMTRKDNMP